MQGYVSMTLTKDQLKDSVAKCLSIPEHEASRYVEFLLETLKVCLASGENVLISGFGKFFVRRKRARRGRNPQTGEGLTLKPRTVITFRCSPGMRDKVNRRS